MKNVKRNLLYLLAWLVLLLAGCTSLPKDFAFTPSYHLPDHSTSTLSKLAGELIPESETGKTGVLLLDDNEKAFLSRVVAIDLADLTLDLQYYHWQADEAGLILMQRLIEAADRGVRVRLLIDDSNSWDSHKKQTALARINYHPNIQVKIYNPLGGSFSGAGMRSLAILGNFDRVNHRMHNKLFIADNHLAIFGGRNIGNIYFGLGKEKNFRDMDVLAIGPHVSSISKAFDSYWNSEWTYPVEVIEKKTFTAEEIEAGNERLSQLVNEIEGFPYQMLSTQEQRLKLLKATGENLDWAELTVFADPPRKDLQDKSESIYYRFRDSGLKPEYEVVASSPYFIPTEEMIAQIKVLINEGVTYRILTNSLASNDVTMAQYGYAARRRALLESDMELYELRTDALDRSNYTAPPYRDSVLGLHAKVSVLDEKKVLIGSYNLDPRSMNINTEVVVMIESSELAEKIRTALLRDMSPRNSYQVFLETEKDDKGKTEFGAMRWRGEEGGKLVIHKNEPNANFMKKFGELLFGILPIDDQL